MYLQCLAHIKGPINSSNYVIGLSSWTAFPLLSDSHSSFNTTAETPSLRESWVTRLLSTIIILCVIPFVYNAFLSSTIASLFILSFFLSSPASPAPRVNSGLYLIHKYLLSERLHDVNFTRAGIPSPWYPQGLHSGQENSS